MTDKMITITTNKQYISPSQKKVLQFIGSYMLKNGYAPTQEEIAQGTGFKRGIVQYYIVHLERKGYLQRVGTHRRNLNVVMHS